MPEDERAMANMEVVLEETCNRFPHGGEHEIRRFIAERLIEAAKVEHATLSELRLVARLALTEVTRWRA